MDNDSGQWPIPRDVVIKEVAFAKERPTLKDAQCIIDFLNVTFRGVYNPEAFELIDSIEKHFKESNDKIIRETTQNTVENFLNQEFGQAIIDVDDEQIEVAILQTTEVMASKRDWAGIFIILKDFCKWPKQYKDFEERVKRLNLPNFPKHLSFDYTALHQGFDGKWPREYKKWLTYSGEDVNFDQRKRVADKFLKNLKLQAYNHS